MLKSENRRGGELSVIGIELWSRWRKYTWQWFMKIRLKAAFLAKMAQQRIRTHTRGETEQVHLFQTLRHLSTERHLHRLATMQELDFPKSKVCHPDMFIYILLLPMLNSLNLRHMTRITCAIKIVFQICWLMEEHPLVSTVSAAWWFSWQPFCRWEQPTERMWHWWRALIERNRIFWVLLLSTSSRKFTVYHKGYIYMHN